MTKMRCLLEILDNWMVSLTGVLSLIGTLLVCVCANSCPGKPNLLPFNENDLHFVKSVPNGKLYQTSNIDPAISVVHLYGTPYQMGYAHGQLLKDLVDEFIPQVMQYLEDKVGTVLQFLPVWLQKIIEVEGLYAALELTYYATREYVDQRWIDEIQGIADGSGLDYQSIANLHVFPELIQAACSIVGAWGDSIKNTNGTLYQLRALDWSVDGPFQKWPALFVYHPNSDNGHPFSILSFAGFVGAITGYSSAPVGVCEKVWLSYNGTENRFGIPWHYLLRDILQFDSDVSDAITRIANAKRTCSIHVGLGDPQNFKLVEYGYDYIQVYDDVNYPVYEGHPKMKNLVYVNKHKQPSKEPCLGEALQEGYGSIDAEYLIRYVAAPHQTGDSHAAVYDFAQDSIYVSIASPYINGSFVPAYDRQYTKFNMTQLFSETQ
uniref:Acid ceramidase N-terminal domain-containing protein n=1 Tax=Arcella intermedia TaxID=1963864 RepID=A0A6B2L4U1_9EUKA